MMMKSQAKHSSIGALRVSGETDAEDLEWDEENAWRSTFPNPRTNALANPRIWTALGVLALVAVLVVATVLAVSSGDEDIQQPVESFRVLVLGDFGRGGGYNQSRTAQSMASWAKSQGPLDLIINTGDNFYEDGLRNGRDSMFDWSFSQVYVQQELQVPFLGVLGNHDYHGNVTAQTSGELAVRDPRFLVYTEGTSDVYRVPPNQTLQFFFLDTTPFIENYRKDPCKSCTASGVCKDKKWGGCKVYDWSLLGGYDPDMDGADEDWQALLKEKIERLRKDLRKSSVDWKIVVAHHPVRSQGNHGDSKELLQAGLEDLLEEEGVPLYLNGHDHNLQHIRVEGSKVNYLCSGAGSMVGSDEDHPYSGMVDAPKLDQDFFLDSPGFLYLSFLGKVAHGHFVQSVPSVEDRYHFHAMLD